MLLAILGVPDEDIIADFTLTEQATDRLVTDWHAAHPDQELRWPGYGRAPAEVMRRFLDELIRRYGSVRGYANERVGIDGVLIARLRNNLLEH